MKRFAFFLSVFPLVSTFVILLLVTLIIALASLFQAQANAAQATANLVGQCITGFMVFVALIAGTGIGYGVYAGRIALTARRESQRKWGVSSNAQLHKFPQRQKQETIAFPSSSTPEYFLADEVDGEDELTDFLLTHWR